MRRKKILLVILLIMISLIGCSNKKPKDIEMPDIVFMYMVDYSYVASEGDNLYTITFCDKNGNLYLLEDDSSCELGYRQLIMEYSSGNLDDKIELQSKVDADILSEQYKLLLDVASNEEYTILYSEYSLGVEAARHGWYGILYDENGELKCIKLHCNDENGDHYSNDKRANEIYNWYADSFE